MGSRGLGLAIACALFTQGTAFGVFPSFGSFVGTLKHDSLKREQLAKLELISSREVGNELELIGILTLHFGDFRSGEYVNYHFDKVIYQPLNKSRPLVFEQSDQDVTIAVDSFKPDEIVGKLRPNFGGGDFGTLVLRRSTTATPSLPLLQKIGGDYVGQCSGAKNWRLKIQAFRNTTDTSRVGNPFGAYEMQAQLGELSKDFKCPLGADGGFCTRYLMTSGSYNFFKNDLRLTGKTRSMKCSTTQDGLDCGSCKFKGAKGDLAPKTSYEYVRPAPAADILSPAVSSSPALTANTAAIEGNYTGYLHHEYLDAYQPVSLNIITFQAPTGGAATSLRMSAVATLFFGGFASDEMIAYKFTEREYPNPLTAPHFVFKRSENDVDAILQVTSIKDGEIRGNWNSILFGRVGSFSVRKGSAPELPHGAHTLSALTAPYESSDWDLDLVVGLDKTPPNTDNPFFPLALGGHFYHKDGLVPRIPVVGGSYNFYTGQIAFQMGAMHRVISGVRQQDGKFRVTWTPAVTLTPLNLGDTVFRVRPEEEAPL